MPSGQSVITTAQTMMTSVSQGLDKLVTSVEEHLAHVERRRDHIQSLLHGSHQEGAAKMFEALDNSVDALKRCHTAIEGLPKAAAAIEARL